MACVLCLHVYPDAEHDNTNMVPVTRAFQPGLQIYCNYFNIPIPDLICEECIELTNEYKCCRCEMGIVGHEHPLDIKRTWEDHGKVAPPLRNCVWCAIEICEACTVRIQDNHDFVDVIKEDNYVIDEPICLDCHWIEISSVMARERISQTHGGESKAVDRILNSKAGQRMIQKAKDQRIPLFSVSLGRMVDPPAD